MLRDVAQRDIMNYKQSRDFFCMKQFRFNDRNKIYHAHPVNFRFKNLKPKNSLVVHWKEIYGLELKAYLNQLFAPKAKKLVLNSIQILLQNVAQKHF